MKYIMAICAAFFTVSASAHAQPRIENTGGTPVLAPKTPAGQKFDNTVLTAVALNYAKMLMLQKDLAYTAETGKAASYAAFGPRSVQEDGKNTPVYEANIMRTAGSSCDIYVTINAADLSVLSLNPNDGTCAAL